PDPAGGPWQAHVPVPRIRQEVGGQRIEPGDVPRGGVVDRIGGEASIEIWWIRAEVVHAALAEMPLARVLPAEKLAAELYVVRAAHPCEIVPRGDHPLVEPLRKVL